MLVKFGKSGKPRWLLIDVVKQIVVPTGDPLIAVLSHDTAGHQAVQMKVGIEFLVPAVQEYQKAQHAV